MGESFFGILFSIWSLSQPFPSYTSNRGFEQKPVEWSCGPVAWSDDSGVQNDQFKGTVVANCEFVSLHGGGFPQLDKHLNERVIHSPETEKVHSGPRPETFQGLPSTFYDVTAKLGDGSDIAHVRSDTHIATESKTRLIFATLSTQIQGSGNAKYLKKTDVVAEVFPKKAVGKYQVKIKAYAILDRPWFLPVGSFEKLIRDQVQKQAHKTQEALVKELAENL